MLVVAVRHRHIETAICIQTQTRTHTHTHTHTQTYKYKYTETYILQRDTDICSQSLTSSSAGAVPYLISEKVMASASAWSEVRNCWSFMMSLRLVLALAAGAAGVLFTAQADIVAIWVKEILEEEGISSLVGGISKSQQP
jgi:hypothetical protein